MDNRQYSERANKCSASIMAHFTRAQTSLVAFLAQIPIQDIRKAAIWSSARTFAYHYAITQQARDDASFGRAVLQSAHP